MVKITLTCSCDDALFGGKRVIGMDCVLRNSQGAFLGCFANTMLRVLSSNLLLRSLLMRSTLRNLMIQSLVSLFKIAVFSANRGFSLFVLPRDKLITLLMFWLDSL